MKAVERRVIPWWQDDDEEQAIRQAGNRTNYRGALLALRQIRDDLFNPNTTLFSRSGIFSALYTTCMLLTHSRRYHRALVKLAALLNKR